MSTYRRCSNPHPTIPGIECKIFASSEHAKHRSEIGRTWERRIIDEWPNDGSGWDRPMEFALGDRVIFALPSNPKVTQRVVVLAAYLPGGTPGKIWDYGIGYVDESNAPVGELWGASESELRAA